MNRTIYLPHVDVWCSFETLNLWTLKLTRADWTDWKRAWIAFSPFLLPNFSSLHYIDCNVRRVLNSSCGGVVFLLRMINEGSCPQKPEVFFLIRQAMLIKLLKCSLITGSPLIPTFLFSWGFMSVCVCVYVLYVCKVSTDVMSCVFGGWDRQLLTLSPTCPLVLHDWVCFSFHHCDNHKETRPGFEVCHSLGYPALWQLDSLQSTHQILAFHCTRAAPDTYCY